MESQNQLEKIRKEKSKMERIDKMIMSEIEEECKHCCKFLGLTKSWHSEETDDSNLQDQKINALVSQLRKKLLLCNCNYRFIDEILDKVQDRKCTLFLLTAKILNLSDCIF